METRKHLRTYVHHRNYINKGNGEFTFLRHPIQAVLLAKIAYDWLPLWACIVLVAGYISGCWLYGWGWDRYKGFNEEIEWSNERNQTLQEIKTEVNTKPTLKKERLK